jgi:hypothetical protein
MIFLNPGVLRPLYQTVGPITLDSYVLSPDGVNPQSVGNVMVGVTPTLPLYNGTLAITGPDASFFQLSSTTLPAQVLAKATTTDGRSYQIQIIASLPGASNNPFVSNILTIVTLTVIFSPTGGVTIPSTTPPGTVVAILQGLWSDGSPFTGSFTFVAPNFNDHGLYAITGPNGDGTFNLVLNAALNVNGELDNVTIEAVQ